MNKTILGIETLEEFKNILQNNSGLIIIKLGAEWCKPCRNIEPLVNEWFNRLNLINSVQTYLVDIDENLEIYAFLKNKKMLKGIPAILMYKKGNTSYIFDDCVNSSNQNEVDQFFTRCIQNAKK
jgi:thiol-disulfide isomerase/thioredoxin